MNTNRKDNIKQDSPAESSIGLNELQLEEKYFEKLLEILFFYYYFFLFFIYLTEK
jgi:hypothetical protein